MKKHSFFYCNVTLNSCFTFFNEISIGNLLFNIILSNYIFTLFKNIYYIFQLFLLLMKNLQMYLKFFLNPHNLKIEKVLFFLMRS